MFRIVIVVLWLSSLLAVGTLASGQFHGFDALADPYVLSGDDIGFRVEGVVEDAPAGRLVIRGKDGEWVAAEQVPDALPFRGLGRRWVPPEQVPDSPPLR